MTASNALLVITATCTALMAGLFYSYSCSVMLGIRSLPDSEYIATMQFINRAIQNPIFFISFFGALLLLPVTTFVNYSQPLSARFWLLLIATIIYFIGAFCVTAFGNIPLNNTLEKFNLLNASTESIHLQRINFEGKWNSLNTVRTISSVLSLILVIIGCINHDKN